MAELSWTSQTDALWECIELLVSEPGAIFTLEEIYMAEPILQRLYPTNNHLKAKIRQQLQVLRDHQYLQFVNNNGIYCRLK